jgi:hypothetical protein
MAFRLGSPVEVEGKFVILSEAKNVGIGFP